MININKDEWIKVATHQIVEDSGEIINDKVLTNTEGQIRTHIKTMLDSAQLLWENSVGSFIARS